MSRFVAILARFAVIVFGYAAASLTASLFMNVVIAGAGVVEASETDELYRVDLIVSTAVGALFVGYFAFLPAMVAITVGEIANRRDWLFYALGGAVISAVVVTLFWATGSEAENDPAFFLMLIAAGIAGSWVYWLIAGRNAGSWRKPPGPAPVISTPPEES
ncbi:MAG: hypothetical protein R3D45_13105 [Rhizobiaceae bacterium]